tara:strand:- start:2474 stop:4345 length:1872 start_codon:yes stop_codon:yes gene_type:complete
MPSTVYKGDLAEVSFAPEVGITITPGGTDCVATIGKTAGDDFSEIVFSVQANTTLFDTSHRLKYPSGMLVGSQLKFTQNSASTNMDSKDLDRVFTIVDNNGTSLKISPQTFTANAIVINNKTDMHILPYKTPPLNTDMTFLGSSESVLTDQFLGIANALTVPETKVDLKRFHVVGLGRDTSVQVPGKFITEGGSFEVAMHSARWLKYCLGGEVVEDGSAPSSPSPTTLSAATEAGQSFITVASATSFNVNKYVIIEEAVAVPIVTTHEADGATWGGNFVETKFDNANKHEARRIIGVDGTRIYLDEPLLFPHTSGEHVYLRDYDDANTNAPAISDAGVITNSQTHLLFTHTHQPSFSLEVSQRRRDVDSNEGGTDGGATDSKELTRVFRGCKVTDFTMTTDNDAALRLAVNFNSALCYTDTGRLNGGASNYAAHRMFDDTANTAAKRLISGIGAKTQKPYMFYNGTINMAGQQVAQVLNFTLTGQTGMQAFHTINGQNSQTSATARVPFGGSRNTSIMVEGQTSFEMTMEIGVDDPLFYHKMRSAEEFSTNADGNTNNQIRINFEKTTTSGSGHTERMMLIIDDYIIIEAPLQIPEDKGMVKSTLKIMPKTIKVIARDTIIKY